MSQTNPSIDDYQDPQNCPQPRPGLDLFSSETQELHQSIDSAARRHGTPYLHPQDPTLQLDMLGSRHMVDWQERKAESVLAGEECWSELHQFYARYGVETNRKLVARVRALENAAGVILTDCGMQAVALTFDVLAANIGGHAILVRGVYNKTRRYLEWLGNRLTIEISIVNDGDYEGMEKAMRSDTFLIFAETYTNPLMRALDPVRMGKLVVESRKKIAPKLRLILDNTIATPWGLQKPLLDFEGMDFIVASGTKALGGQDCDLWGYIASNRVDFLNEIMDLQAMRGGALDWRRGQAILEGLGVAEDRFKKRTRSAIEVARFLASHPRIESVYHPSLPDHPDRKIIDSFYAQNGSLLSFKIAGADEEKSRVFADVLATCIVLRYAGSFDGLATKINHHRTVSEYFTPEEELKKANIDRILRVGVGLESPKDIIACLNWALWHFEKIPEKDVLSWQKKREKDLGIRGER